MVSVYKNQKQKIPKLAFSKCCSHFNAPVKVQGTAKRKKCKRMSVPKCFDQLQFICELVHINAQQR